MTTNRGDSEGARDPVPGASCRHAGQRGRGLYRCLLALAAFVLVTGRVEAVKLSKSVFAAYMDGKKAVLTEPEQAIRDLRSALKQDPDEGLRDSEQRGLRVPYYPSCHLATAYWTVHKCEDAEAALRTCERGGGLELELGASAVGLKRDIQACLTPRVTCCFGNQDPDKELSEDECKAAGGRSGALCDQELGNCCSKEEMNLGPRLAAWRCEEDHPGSTWLPPGTPCSTLGRPKGRCSRPDGSYRDGLYDGRCAAGETWSPGPADVGSCWDEQAASWSEGVSGADCDRLLFWQGEGRRPQNPRGACCKQGSPVETDSARDCVQVGGTFSVARSTRPDPLADCVPPREATVACCLPTGDCENLTPLECASRKGSKRPAGSSCNAATAAGCREAVLNPTGACCLDGGEKCAVLTAAECVARAGAWQGANRSCRSGPCEALLKRPCCLDGSNLGNLTKSDCKARQGVWLLDAAQARTCTKGDRRWACCRAAEDGGEACIETLPGECTGGEFHDGVFHDGVFCDADGWTCVAPRQRIGRCDWNDSGTPRCDNLAETQCSARDGRFRAGEWCP